MSQSKNIEDFINVLVVSFITTTIVIVGRDVIQILNDKIKKLNGDVKQLKDVIKENDDKHNFHLKEIEASYKTKFDDFTIKYNNDMLSVNANIKGQISTLDETVGEICDDISKLNDDIKYNSDAIVTVIAQSTILNNQVLVLQTEVKQYMNNDF